MKWYLNFPPLQRMLKLLFIFSYVFCFTENQGLPNVLQQDGLVVVGGKRCKHTKQLVDFMNKNGITYTLKYIEDDQELKKYIIKQYNGAIPWVWEDKILVGDGDTFMKLYKQEQEWLRCSTQKNTVFLVDKEIFRQGLNKFQILPRALQGDGTVVVGSKKCKFTKELVDWLNKNSKSYKMAYIDNDKELERYIVDNYNGGVPVVFENGVSQGSGKEYMDRHNNSSTPVVNKMIPGVNTPLPNPVRATGLKSSDASSFQVFVKQLQKSQGIKTRKQIIEDADIVGKAFSEREVQEMDLLRNISAYDVFKYKEGEELIAFVYIRRNTFYKKVGYFFFTRIEEVKAVEIYSLWVNEKYRGQGIARRLLFDALTTIREEYDYGNDFVVSLHLNESDAFMNISFGLYYSMNFTKGCFVRYGPDEIQSNYERIHYLKNPVDIILGYSKTSDKGKYFAMYTTMNKILFFNPVRNKSLYEIGEMLREELKKRKLAN